MNILVLNAGSTTLKASIVTPHGEVAAAWSEDRWDGASAAIFDHIDTDHPLAGVGHRVVHGGPVPRAPAALDHELERELARWTPLAPLHQARALRVVRMARERLPHLPHVACFDSYYHRTLPDHAATYPLPASWRRRWPIRRLGFHGWSHAHVARRAPALAGTDATARIVSCHLGSGVSLCAIRDGRSLDTTMGFTPAEGPAMATRSGTVDPGLLLWLTTEAGLDASSVRRSLAERSGLTGMAGGNGDARTVLDAARAGDVDARLALAVYGHRLHQSVGAMAASLRGVDVLAFTGGVGVHLPEIRTLVAGGLAHLGVIVDPDRNARADGDARLSPDGTAVATVVVATGEHLSIAAAVRDVLRA